MTAKSAPRVWERVRHIATLGRALRILRAGSPADLQVLLESGMPYDPDLRRVRLDGEWMDLRSLEALVAGDPNAVHRGADFLTAYLSLQGLVVRLDVLMGARGPHSPAVRSQDWFEPWQVHDIPREIEQDVLAYASCLVVPYEEKIVKENRDGS